MTALVLIFTRQPSNQLVPMDHNTRPPAGWVQVPSIGPYQGLAFGAGTADLNTSGWAWRPVRRHV